MGPLAIASSAWRVPANLDGLYCESLEPFFRPHPYKGPISWIPLGDSKAIYRNGFTIGPLTCGVMACLAMCKHQKADMRHPESLFLQRDSDRQSLLPWYEPRWDDPADRALFPEARGGFSESLWSHASQHLTSLGVSLDSIQAILLNEAEFNARLVEDGNKSNILSKLSLGLASQVLEDSTQREHEISQIDVVCDKHGGRNRYAAFLHHAFPGGWFHVVQESRDQSIYEGLYKDVPIRWSFVAKGDRIVPPALASMTAKWLREVMMARLNRFWSHHQPGIRATAGYPLDARRFRAEIESSAVCRNLPTDHWWRRV